MVFFVLDLLPQRLPRLFVALRVDACSRVEEEECAAVLQICSKKFVFQVGAADDKHLILSWVMLIEDSTAMFHLWCPVKWALFQLWLSSHVSATALRVTLVGPQCLSKAMCQMQFLISSLGDAVGCVP